MNTESTDHLHEVSYLQGVWSAMRGTAPRALCGVSLEGKPGDVDRFDAPPCPDCEARTRYGARPLARPVAHQYSSPVRVWAPRLNPGDVIEDYEDHGPVVRVTRLRWWVRVTMADGAELEWSRVGRPHVIGKDEPR